MISFRETSNIGPRMQIVPQCPVHTSQNICSKMPKTTLPIEGIKASINLIGTLQIYAFYFVSTCSYPESENS